MAIVSIPIVSVAIVSMAIASMAIVSIAIVSMAIVSMAIVSIAEGLAEARTGQERALATAPPYGYSTHLTMAIARTSLWL
jgi:hypothetical protein